MPTSIFFQSEIQLIKRFSGQPGKNESMHRLVCKLALLVNHTNLSYS